MNPTPTPTPAIEPSSSSPAGRDRDRQGPASPAERLTSWARGDLSPVAGGAPSVVVSACRRATPWLVEQVGADTLVLAPRPRGQDRLPAGPGTWLGVAGAFDEPGDELEVTPELWVQTIDYQSLPYLGVAGPTVVRLLSGEDAHAFLRDVELLAGGGVPEALLHPMVELGDRCALRGEPCTSTGVGRLHVDAEGQVRTAPRGQVLGAVGDPVAGLPAAPVLRDPCLPADVTEVLAGADAVAVRRFLGAVDAVRVLRASTQRSWSLHRDPEGVLAPRADLLLLQDGQQQVLFAVAARRAFRVSPEVARVLAALLSSTTTAEAADRLGEAHGDRRGTGEPAALVRAVLARFDAVGLDVQPRTAPEGS